MDQWPNIPHIQNKLKERKEKITEQTWVTATVTQASSEWSQEVCWSTDGTLNFHLPIRFDIGGGPEIIHQEKFSLKITDIHVKKIAGQDES